MSSTSVARAKFNTEKLNFKNIFQAQPPINSGYHFGSRLVIKNKHLYVTAGERGQGMIAQDYTKHPGSIIRVNLDGSIPKDNPKFINKKNWLPEIYQIGVRNPQGMDVDPLTNDVFISNHGPKGGDFIGKVIKGTNYGALETATLQEDSDAKYCGMCVEMTGENGTAIVQIVDECPDCWEHNSGDTDIDLSPSAFAAVVGDQGIGRSDITWEEVSCPWSTPIDLRFESAHEWNVKVIIANHVNRIDKVEITHDGQWVDMERGADNGWVKGSLFGQTKSISSSVAKRLH